MILISIKNIPLFIKIPIRKSLPVGRQGKSQIVNHYCNSITAAFSATYRGAVALIPKYIQSAARAIVGPSIIQGASEYWDL